MLLFFLQSEERGKDESSKPTVLRPAGSSPCVAPPETMSAHQQQQQQSSDLEEGIYHGFYRVGVWICITDREVWKKHEIPLFKTGAQIPIFNTK